MQVLTRGVALLALVAGTAQAGLFDDEEARKAILDLRQRISQNDEAARARAAELGAAQAQLLEQLAALRRSLLELNNQIDALRNEQATLRGSNEQLARELAELQRRQRDAGQALDERLRKLEPVKVAVDGLEFLADPEEKRSFDEALAVLRGGDFERAATAMAAFLRRYPASGYAPSARFWLGSAQYGRRDHKEAVNTLRAFVSAEPAHPRASEALLAIANSQAELRDVKTARKTLEELMKSYPRSEAAAAGKERLATLK
jgi:tol-pal system protein YbgF